MKVVFLSLLVALVPSVSGQNATAADLTRAQAFCLGRNNPLYWTTILPVVAKLESYHEFVASEGFVEGDDFVIAEQVCEQPAASYNAVAAALQEMVVKLDAGVGFRTNNLGLLRFPEEAFTCAVEEIYADGFCGLGLGIANSDHSKVRLFYDELMGTGNSMAPWVDATDNWSLMDIKEKAEDFFEGRDSIVAAVDGGTFFVHYWHNQILQVNMTIDEAAELLSFAEFYLYATGLPRVPVVFNPRRIRKRRAPYVQLFKDSFTNGIASGRFTTLAPEDVTLAAEALFDAFLFAFVPSLTGTSKSVLGAYLNNLGNVTAVVTDWTSHSDLGRVIMEAVRVYPPVLGVPWVELDGIRYSGLVGYSGYDRTQFGPTAYDFNILFSTVQEYQDTLINWADRAYPVSGKPETSHICPGRSLSYNMLLGFFSAMGVDQWVAGPDGPPDVGRSSLGPFFWDDFEVVRA